MCASGPRARRTWHPRAPASCACKRQQNKLLTFRYVNIQTQATSYQEAILLLDSLSIVRDDQIAKLSSATTQNLITCALWVLPVPPSCRSSIEPTTSAAAATQAPQRLSHCAQSCDPTPLRPLLCQRQLRRRRALLVMNLCGARRRHLLSKPQVAPQVLCRIHEKRAT